MIAGNIIYAACQWGMLSAIAKIGSAESVGEFALALAITSPVFLFSNLSLRSVQVTDIKRQFGFSDYISLRWITIVLSFLVLFTFPIALSLSQSTFLIVIAMAFTKMGDSISDIVYGSLQNERRMDRIAISRIMQGLIQLASLAITFYFTKSLLLAVTTMALSSIAITLTYDIFSLHAMLPVSDHEAHTKVMVRSRWTQGLSSLRIRWEFESIRTLAIIALPLGVVAFLDVLVLNIPRYYIDHFGGKAELGYYSAISYIMISGGTVISAVAESVRPQLAVYFSTNRNLFINLLAKLLLISFLIGIFGVIVALCFGRTLLGALYNEEYAQHSHLFAWVMVTAAVWYSSTFLTTSIVATRVFTALTPLLLLTTSATALSCALLVPSYGMLGGAWAACIGMVTRLLGGVFILVAIARQRDKEPGKIHLKVFYATGILLAASSVYLWKSDEVGREGRLDKVIPANNEISEPQLEPSGNFVEKKTRTMSRQQLKELWNLGASAKHRGDYVAARRAWERGLEIEPDNVGFKESIDKLPIK
ncbi:hypothetical protein [Abditibacterium utsteinense]|nr:hypothetical protein [Abditibacterium utsteinense]